MNLTCKTTLQSLLSFLKDLRLWNLIKCSYTVPHNEGAIRCGLTAIGIGIRKTLMKVHSLLF